MEAGLACFARRAVKLCRGKLEQNGYSEVPAKPSPQVDLEPVTEYMAHTTTLCSLYRLRGSTRQGFN